jgi:hypothetical protein
MNWRRFWPWLLVLAAVVMWFGLRGLKRQTAVAPAPPAARAAPAPKPAEPIDLTQHDGAVIDFSSGSPVIKNTPADRAAVARAVKTMDDATKDVTFKPAETKQTETKTAETKPAEPPKR